LTGVRTTKHDVRETEHDRDQDQSQGEPQEDAARPAAAWTVGDSSLALPTQGRPAPRAEHASRVVQCLAIAATYMLGSTHRPLSTPRRRSLRRRLRFARTRPVPRSAGAQLGNSPPVLRATTGPLIESSSSGPPDSSGETKMADTDNVRESKNYCLDVPVKREAFFLKGSTALDWGMQNRLARIFRPSSGRTVMLAIDHGYFQGPTSGLERVDVNIVPLLPYCDALMLTRGILRTTIPPGFWSGSRGARERRPECAQGPIQRALGDRRRRCRPA